MGVPIFHGRIDKSLFQTSLRNLDSMSRGQRAASRHVVLN